MYSVLCLKRDLSVIICKRTTHGVFSALTIRKMSNVTFGAASGIFFFLRKNQTKSTRRPICFHISRIFLFLAFWSCLGVYQHLRNFGSATSYLTQKICTPCIDAGDITSWMSLLQRCFPFFRSTTASGGEVAGLTAFIMFDKFSFGVIWRVVIWEHVNGLIFFSSL